MRWVLFISCLVSAGSPSGMTPCDASAARVKNWVQALASDAFAGREPGTAGEKLTIHYLTHTLASLGYDLDNNILRQPVPLLGTLANAAVTLRVRHATRPLLIPDDIVVWTRRDTSTVRLNELDMVFAGYGVTAPEWSWDDYAHLDVRDKAVVVLVGDPPLADPNRFHHETLTAYGRWTYKRDMAAARGAAAVLLIHEEHTAGYPYDTVINTWTSEQFTISESRLAAEAWISHATAEALFASSGHNLQDAKRLALAQQHAAMALKANISIDLRVVPRHIKSHNIIARRVGHRAQEHLIVSAHWDHLGTDPKTPGRVMHGAMDNASGIAAILELARRIQAGPPLARTVLFLMTTAEEKGLLGAAWYARHPLLPLDSTIININLDIMNVWGRTQAIIDRARGTSTSDARFDRHAARQGRVVLADPEPWRGYYFRSDHFELAKHGIPGIFFLLPGDHYIDRPPDFAIQQRADYIERRYHQPSDEFSEDWDLRGMCDDIDLLESVIRDFGSHADRPRLLRQPRSVSLTSTP